MAFCEVKPEHLKWVMGYAHTLMKEGKTIEQIISEVRQELPGNQPFLTNTLLSKIPAFMQMLMSKNSVLGRQYGANFLEIQDIKDRFEGPEGYNEVAKFNNNVQLKDEVEAEILDIKEEVEEEVTPEKEPVTLLKPKVKRKSPGLSREAKKAMSYETFDPYGETIKYFLLGGKLHESGLLDIFKDNVLAEKNARIKYISSDKKLLKNGDLESASGVDSLAHYLWEGTDLRQEDGFPIYSTEDYKAAVIEIVRGTTDLKELALDFIAINNMKAAEEEYYRSRLGELTEEEQDREDFPDAYLETYFRERQAAEKELGVLIEIGDGIKLEIKTQTYETKQEKGETREGEKDSGKQNGQRVIQDFGKNFQPKFSNAVPYGLEGKLADHQKTGVNAIVQAVSSNNSFLLADGAGAGKTRILLTSARVLKERGRKVIIVTQNKDIIQGSFKADSATLGMSFIKGKNDAVEIGGVPVVTIDNFSKVLDPRGFDTIILDESHKASGLVSEASKKLRGFEGQVVYASATPFDTESKTLYILPRLLGMNEESYLETIGGKLKKIPRRAEPDLIYDTAKFNSLMNTVHSRFISEGKMLHRRFEFYGNDKLDLNTIGNADEFGGGYSIEELEERIRELAREKAKKVFLTDADVRAGETVESKKRKVYEQTANQIKSVPETFKANNDMIAQVQKDLADGKQVIIYSVNVKEDGMSYKILNREGEEETVNRPAMITQMEKKLKDRNIDFGVVTGKIRNRPAIVDKFQKGELKVLLINESGTTGINLNDTVGNAPRKLYIAGALPSAIQLEQVKGRVSRINNASAAEVSYVSVNSSAEGRNREKLIAKMAIMNSILTGEQLNNVIGKQNKIEEIKKTVKDGFIEPYLEDTDGGAKFLVKGSTQEIKDILKTLGARGIYSAPKVFSGWEFPAIRKQEIQDFLNTTFNKVADINKGIGRVNEEISAIGQEAPTTTKPEVPNRIQNILGDIVSPSEEMIRKSQDEQNKRC